MKNNEILSAIESKAIGAEQILFLLNQNSASEYEDVIDIVRGTLADILELTDKLR